MFPLIFTIIFTLVLVIFFYRLDKNKEPVSAIFRAFIYGFAAALLELFIFRLAILKFFYGDDLLNFTLLLNDEIDTPNFRQFVFSGFVIGGFLKESIKIFVFYQLTRKIRDKIDEPYDSILYALIFCLGFQMFENLLFVRTEWNPVNFFGFVSLMKHLITGVVMGFAYEKLREDRLRNIKGSSFIWETRKVPMNKAEKTVLVISLTLIQVFVHVILRLSFQINHLLTLGIGALSLIFLTRYAYKLLITTYKTT